MVTTPSSSLPPAILISWEKLPDDIPLEDEPVENTAQPLIAGALRESLELAGYLKPEMLVASNLGICATVNENLVIKAPDWFYVASAQPAPDRRSYTPNLEGEVPRVVMEFLSDTDGGEYSAKRTFPLGKWFFYEQILQVPTYVLFAPATGELEIHQLQPTGYKLMPVSTRYWLADMELFLGVWQGEKEGRSGYWLRWWNQAGDLLLWAVEKVEQEQDQAKQAHKLAEQERNRAEQEHERAERLAAYLRSQGLDPDQIT